MEQNTAPGWDAITETFEKMYPGQTEPQHFAPLVSWQLGGGDPLDGISVYDGGDYWHFVTYGLSELYKKESENPEYSGYGMEFTFKLKKSYSADMDEREIKNVCNILQQIAGITFESGTLFLPNQYVYTGQTDGIDAEQKSSLTGFIIVLDKDADMIKTPFGQVSFVEFVGAADNELKAIMNKQITVQDLYQLLGTDITDYHRTSLF